MKRLKAITSLVLACALVLTGCGSSAPAENNQGNEAKTDTLTESGTYTGDYNELVISATGVVLENVTAEKIIIAKEVADGDVTFKNVDVATLEVYGGGQETVYLYNSSVDVMIADKQAAEGAKATQVLINVEDGTAIGDIDATNAVVYVKKASKGIGEAVVNENAQIIFEQDAKADKVVVADATASAEIAGAVTTVEVKASKAKVKVGETAVVKTVNVAEAATEAQVDIEGQVEEVAVDAENTQVNVAPTATVNKVNVSKTASSSKVAVNGKVNQIKTEAKVEVSGNGEITGIETTEKGLVEIEAGSTAANKAEVTVTPSEGSSGNTPAAPATPAATPIPHTHSYVSTVTTQQSCTKEGVTTYVCQCGDTYTEKLGKLGHDYDSGKVTTAATCMDDGVKTYTCSRCKKTKTEVIKAKGHLVDGTAVCTGCNTAISELVKAADAKITLTADITLANVAGISKNSGWLNFEAAGITLDGAGFTIDASAAVFEDTFNDGSFKAQVINVGDTGKPANNTTIKNLTVKANRAETSSGHAINVYGSADVVLDNLTLSGGKANIMVNGSSVKASAITASDSAWYDVGVFGGSSFEVDTISAMTGAGQVVTDAASTVTITGADPYSAVDLGSGNKAYTNTVMATIGATNYASIDAALAVAVAGDVIDMLGNTYDKYITLDKAVTIKNMKLEVAGVTTETYPINTNDNDLTLIDCEITRTDKVAPPYGYLVNAGAGKLVAKGVVFTAPVQDYAYVSANSPSVIEARGGVDLNQCTIKTNGYGLFSQHVVKGEIKETTFKGLDDGTRIYAAVNSTVLEGLKFDDCIFEMGRSSNVLAGSYTFNKCTFDMNGTTNDDAANCLNVYTDGNVVITNNTFKLVDGTRAVNFTWASWAPGTFDASKITFENNAVTGTTSAGAIRIVNTQGYWTGFDADKLDAENALNGNAVVFTAAATVNGVNYATVAEAVAAATSGQTVELKNNAKIESAISVPAGVTVKGANGMTLTIADNVGAPFTLGEGAALEGINFSVPTPTAGAIEVAYMTSGSKVVNCTFNGTYQMGDGQITRAVVVAPGATGIEISGNVIKNLRQPAYINNGVTGTISGNNVDVTRGFVVCSDSDMTITDNTFGENAVDICIIASNTATDNYAGEEQALADSNNDAMVENQVSGVKVNIPTT